VYQPPTIGHDIFIPELPDYASTYPEQDIPQLSWPTESQMGNLTTFAANFVDDMNSFSSGNFPNQESGDQATVGPNVTSFDSFSASEEVRSKK
jgi:hypothetical protein